MEPVRPITPDIWDAPQIFEMEVEPALKRALEGLRVDPGSATVVVSAFDLGDGDEARVAEFAGRVRGVEFRSYGYGASEVIAQADMLFELRDQIRRFNFDGPASVSARLAGLWVWAVAGGAVLGLIWLIRLIRRIR